MSDASAPGTGPDRHPEEIFEYLHGRPTPELDSGRLWRRIEARMAPRSASPWVRLLGMLSRRPAPRLASALAALAVVAFALWMVLQVLQTSSSQLVLLTPGEPDAAPLSSPATSGNLVLDVRLVRGYDGAPPDDVRSARALGVGGADALQDVRERIETLLPFGDYGVVGAWQGAVPDGGTLDVALSETFRLVARSAASTDGAAVRLDGIELAGAGGETVFGDLNLEAGRLYLLGLFEPGADDPDLVLLIRARAGAEEHR
ncbi:MAG: hypothetical protein PVJ49_18300 [Acidobacteriota bacterium]|jgi:hypothetical protein